MAPRKKTASAKTSGTGKAPTGRKKSKSKSKSPPKAPTRQRVMCPGCSTELILHKTPAQSEAFLYATTTDMNKLGIECQNESCVLYIQGVEHADYNLPVNPVVEKCLKEAKVERTAIKAKKKQEKAEKKKEKRTEKAAEYAPYNPFCGAKEKEAEEAIKQAEQQVKEAKKIIKSWKKVQKATKKLEQFENVVDSVEE